MPSTYSSLKVELIATGEQSGTWGNTTNTNLGTALGEAITGSADVTFINGSDTTVTLTDVNTTQAARNLRLNLIGSANAPQSLILGSGCQINKLYLINNTLGYAITVKNTTGTGIAVPAGKTMFVFNNGTNVVDAITHLTSLSTGAITSTQVNITGQGDLRLEDTTGGEYVALQAPGTLASSYTLTLPVDDGTSGQALVTDGNGVLSWSTAASGDVYGPASSTTNAIPTFADTTGKLLQNNSGVTISSNTVTASGGFSTAANLTFTGTGNRITGDMSNATVANRVAFQSSTTNGSTVIEVLPNGTNTSTSLALRGDSALTNGSQFIITNGANSNTEVRLNSGILGTGTYLPITIYTGGSERLRIDTSGNVGINTNSPSTQLHVVGTTRIARTATPTQFVDLSCTAVNGFNINVSAASGAITMSTNGGTTPMVLLDGLGSLGVGTTAPFSGLELFRSGGQTTAAITTASNLESFITVRQNSAATGAGGGIIFGSQNNAFAAIKGLLTDGSSNTTGDLAFSTRNAVGDATLTERMRITTAGDVGIGITNPTYKLHVNAGTGTNAGPLRLEGTTTSSIFFATNATNGAFNGLTITGDPLILGIQNQSLLVGVHDGSAIRFGDTDMRFGTDSNERMRLDSSGNLGIGVTPSAWGGNFAGLQTKGGFISSQSTLYLYSGQNAYYNGTNWIYTTSAASSIYEQTSGVHIWSGAASGTAGNPITWTERMRIDSSGRVGIGTNSPSVPLTVAPTNTTQAIIGLYNNTAAGGSAFSALRLGSSGQTDRWQVQYDNGTGTLNFYDFTAATTRMTINSSGTVLINTPSTGNVNGGAPKLAVNGGVSVTAGVTQTALFEQGILTNDSGGNNGYWQYLGRFSANQSGAVCAIRYYYHVGFNANNAQNGIIDIFFKTSNAISFQAGSTGNFYGDGQYFKLGPQGVNDVRVVQQSNITDYDIYVQIGNYSNQSFYTVATSGGTYWTDVGTGSTLAPTGNFITLTAQSITYT